MRLDAQSVRTLVDHRKKETERCPHAGRASKGDGSPVILDDLVGEGQAQTGSFFLGREEGVEDAVCCESGIPAPVSSISIFTLRLGVPR